MTRNCIFYLVIFVAIALRGCNSASMSAYVSFNGHDGVGCGNSLSNMCQSIHKAVQNAISQQVDNVTIYLDGGNTKNGYQYNISKTIDMGTITTVKLVKLPSSISIPKVVGLALYSIPLFQFGTVPNLEIQNVFFKRMLLLKFTGTTLPSSTNTVTISLRKIFLTKITGPYLPLIEDKSGSGKPNKHVTVKVILQNFLAEGIQQYALIESYNKQLYWRVEVENSKFYNIGFKLKYVNNGTLKIKDTFFTNSNVSHVIDVSEFEKVYIENVNIENASCTASIIEIYNVKLVNITNSLFHNQDYYDVSLLNVTKVTEFWIQNCSFSDIKAKAAAIIYLDSTRIRMKDIQIKNMKRQYISSLIIIEAKDDVVIQNCIFENTKTSLMKITGMNTLNITQSSLRNCTSPFLVQNVNNTYISHSNFYNNYSPVSGGVFEFIKSNFTIINSIFFNNSAEIQGGAITTSRVGTIIINDSKFVENYASSGGTFYFSSESKVKISNTTIVSPSERIPLFATVIENSGKNITFQNVNITILKTNNSVDIITTGVTQAATIIYNCPTGTNLDVMKKKLWSCKYCDKGQYSLSKSTIVYGFSNETHLKNLTAKCRNCPFGGQCEYGEIKSKGNFWGFIENFEVTFQQCPEGYCCGGDVTRNDQTKCRSISTCNTNRHGTICGECEKNFYVDFFSSDCIPNTKCNKFLEFWVVFVVLGIIIFFIWIYIVDIGNYLSEKDNPKSRNFHITRPLIPVEGNIEDDEESFVDDSMEETALKTSAKSQLMGIFKILVNFYQMNLLITIYHRQYHRSQFIQEFLPTIFNLKLTFKQISTSFCPIKSLDVLTKIFIKDVLFILFLVALATGSIIISKLVIKLKGLSQSSKDSQEGEKTENNGKIAFVLRCKLFILSIFMIGYTNITTFSLALVNCVKIRNDFVLLINGEIPCFQWYQYVDLIFVAVWIFPFSFNLYFSSRLLQQRYISVNAFFACLIFPPVTIIFYLTKVLVTDNEEIENAMRISRDMSYKPIMSILEEPFRQSKSGQRIILWDSAILFRRFFVACLVTFISNPIIRLAVVIPVMLCFCFHNSQTLPYKSYHLNLFDTICFFNLSFLGSVNLYWTFFYVYELPYIPPVSIIGDIFSVVETILLLLPVILLIVVLLFCALRNLFIVLYKRFVGKYR